MLFETNWLEREREKNIFLDEKIMIMENGMYFVKIRHEDQEMLKRNRVIEWSYWNIQVLKYSAKRIRVKCNEDSRWKCEKGANSREMWIN